MTSTSSFIPSDGEPLSNVFTDITPLPSQNYCGIAKAKRYGRWWILKYLKTEYNQQLIYQSLLKKEFELMIGLQHPNIVTTVDWEHVESLGDCIVMEWIDGVNLKAWLKDKHKRGDRLRIARQVTDALGYIHSLQLAHRDLKPSNIMITRNGDNVKLIDFGLSDSDSFAVFKQKAGSPGYMDEQTNKEESILADIYSLGYVFADLQLGMLYRPIVKKCCAPISHRYQHVEDVQNAFLRVSRTPRVAIAAAMVAVVCLLSAFYFSNHNKMSQMVAQTQMDSHRLEDSIQKFRNSNVSQIKTMQSEQNLTSLKNKRIQDSLQTLIKKIESSNETVNQKELLQQKCIKEGKAAIDRMCGPLDRRFKAMNAKTGIEELSNASNEMQNITMRINNEIYSYPKRMGLKEADAANVTNVLSDYSTEKYVKPWMKIMNEISKSITPQQ
jgi:serine/threonine protein kinase